MKSNVNTRKTRRPRFRAGTPIAAALIATMMLAVGTAGDAEARKRPRRKKTVVVKYKKPKRVKVVKTLPKGRVTIKVNGANYHYHGGRFYNHGPKGYVVVKAPRGARIRTLPVGFAVVHFGTRPYYTFGGVYYIYEPDTQDYVVVDKPKADDALDVLVMTDGTSLNGYYLGGSEDTIEFEVGEEVYEIDRGEVLSLTLSPADE